MMSRAAYEHRKVILRPFAAETFIRVEALSTLANHWPELLPQALETAHYLNKDKDRVDILKMPSNQITPELLPQALKAAQSVQEMNHRAEALSALSQHFITHPNRLSLWTNMLHFLSYHSRPSLLRE